MKGIPKYLIIILVVAAATVAVALAFSSKGKSASTWVFTNVTPAQLAAQGVTLTPVATPTSLATTAADASAAASSFTGHAPLVSPQYMHCVDTAHNPQIDQDCWVVSTDTTNMSAPIAAGAGVKAAQIGWDITFVDPTTGTVIEGTLGN